MDAIQEYESGSESGHSPPRVREYSVNSAPDVPIDTDGPRAHQIERFINPNACELYRNPKYEDMYAPVIGPPDPFLSDQQRAPKNILSGYVEIGAVAPVPFEDERRERFVELLKSEERPARKRTKLKNNDPSDVNGYLGPWAPFEDEVRIARPSEDEKRELDEMMNKKEKRNRVTQPDETSEGDCDDRSVLHIRDPYDYQGRSFLHIPTDLDVDLKSEDPPIHCYIPKRCIHTYQGHNKAVQKLELFPVSGHLFLTCSMDTKVKLWEFYGQRRCVRTYIGHKQAVRDICFNNGGDAFLSASYDRTIKLWDTETGSVKGKFNCRKLPYCVVFNPAPHKRINGRLFKIFVKESIDHHRQNYFLVGCSGKKIACFDVRTGSVVQEYDRHLGAVNTITFVDRNRRIISTSDDKSIRVWEWDIPVDFKYIADPSLHSMPAVAQSRNGRYLAFQSMDNQIKIDHCYCNSFWFLNFLGFCERFNYS
ncbi:hypothetical protein ACOME3_000949 [Neoechinorhynchus agilis]